MTRRQFGVDTSYGNLSPSHVASHSFHTLSSSTIKYSKTDKKINTNKKINTDTSYGSLSPSHVASHSFHPHLPQQKITIINTKKDKNTKRLTHKKTNTNTKTNR